LERNSLSLYPMDFENGTYSVVSDPLEDPHRQLTNASATRTLPCDGGARRKPHEDIRPARKSSTVCIRSLACAPWYPRRGHARWDSFRSYPSVVSRSEATFQPSWFLKRGFFPFSQNPPTPKGCRLKVRRGAGSALSWGGPVSTNPFCQSLKDPLRSKILLQGIGCNSLRFNQEDDLPMRAVVNRPLRPCHTSSDTYLFHWCAESIQPTIVRSLDRKMERRRRHVDFETIEVR